MCCLWESLVCVCGFECVLCVGEFVVVCRIELVLCLEIFVQCLGE